jgi:hypothetical protein
MDTNVIQNKSSVKISSLDDLKRNLLLMLEKKQSSMRLPVIFSFSPKT